MIYSNDEADKSIRQRNFYFTVYLAPIALIGILCGLIYWASTNNYLQKTDADFSYFLSLTPALILYSFNRRNWLKMPDGTFHHVKGISPTQKLSFTEPTEYEAEFFYSKTEKTSTALTGFALVGLSAWLGITSSKNIILPISTNAGGLFLIYVGLKGLFDKSAKLKIAKNGLWTHKLGFVDWDDINFAEVLEQKSGNHTQFFLHISLKGTKFEEAGEPDERLLISDLEDNGIIETIINGSITNYNKYKKQNRG